MEILSAVLRYCQTLNGRQVGDFVDGCRGFVRQTGRRDRSERNHRTEGKPVTSEQGRNKDASSPSAACGRDQTRKSKSKIQNPKRIRMSECTKRKHEVAEAMRRTVSDFGPSDFEIVSDFGLLISDFKKMTAPCANFDGFHHRGCWFNLGRKLRSSKAVDKPGLQASYEEGFV